MESQKYAGDHYIALVTAFLGAEKATRFLDLHAAFISGVFLLVMVSKGHGLYFRIQGN